MLRRGLWIQWKPERSSFASTFKFVELPRTRLMQVFIVAAAFSLLCGCSKTASQSSAQMPIEATPVRTQASHGPVSVNLEASQNEIRLSDELKLTIDMDSDPGVAITKPTLGETFGEFTVSNVREPLPSLENGKHRIRQVFTLEPNSAGELKLPSIVVNYEDKRDAAKPVTGKVETEPLTIKVMSSIATDSPTLAQLESASSPVSLPSPPLSALDWALIGVGSVALGALVYGFIRFQRREIAVRSLTPAELAANELEQLRQKNWIETNVKLFYVELTAIVRRFIERTTEVHAPDQTTDEFIRETMGHPAFSTLERRKLQDFLEAADLVKFAAHQPSQSAVVESLRRATLFVGLSDAGGEIAA